MWRERFGTVTVGDGVAYLLDKNTGHVIKRGSLKFSPSSDPVVVETNRS
jgi:hypothetical protein